MTRHTVAAGALVALVVLLGACDECAATPSCHNPPQISYGGQFIEHKSGAPVRGVTVSFVRRSGIEVDLDSISDVSDGDGFFTLRVGSVYDGAATGDLMVVPPAPYSPYTISGLSLRTSRVRGDGASLGRFVVDPYLLLVGHVRDRYTLQPIPDAAVTLRRTSGGRLDQDVRSFTTDFGGQFAWVDPTIIESGTINVTFEITAPGYPRAYVVPREIPLQYRDGDMAFVIIPVGSGLSYVASTGRRATGEQLPGVEVQFRRLSGIMAQPETFSVTPQSNGSFGFPLASTEDGTLVGELVVRPPAPYPPEVDTVTLATSDDDRARFLGVFAYGAQVNFTAMLRDSATGTSIPQGTTVSVKRVGGLPLAWDTPPDGHERVVDAQGRVAYQAPTSASGTVQFDLIVQLPAPFLWDTVRAVVPSVFSDDAYDVGTLAVRRRPRP